MATFSWKRKIGDKISKNAPVRAVFEDDDDYPVLLKTDVSNTFKRRKAALSENCVLKSQELKAEGVKLAERGQYIDAVALWNKALHLTPSDAKILEMKAQALLQLNEPVPALQDSRKAVMLDPQWWIAHQTLGRSQLGVGEIKMAIVSFSRALHINPACQELWTDDLNWAVQLLHEQERQSKEKQIQESHNSAHTNATSESISLGKNQIP